MGRCLRPQWMQLSFLSSVFWLFLLVRVFEVRITVVSLLSFTLPFICIAVFLLQTIVSLSLSHSPWLTASPLPPVLTLCVRGGSFAPLRRRATGLTLTIGIRSLTSCSTF